MKQFLKIKFFFSLKFKIILDMSPYRDSVIILRMLDSSEPLLNQILVQTLDHYKLPFLLIVKNTNYEFKFFSM